MLGETLHCFVKSSSVCAPSGTMFTANGSILYFRFARLVMYLMTSMSGTLFSVSVIRVPPPPPPPPGTAGTPGTPPGAGASSPGMPGAGAGAGATGAAPPPPSSPRRMTMFTPSPFSSSFFDLSTRNSIASRTVASRKSIFGNRMLFSFELMATVLGAVEGPDVMTSLILRSKRLAGRSHSFSTSHSAMARVAL